ncbi:hypothetical protein LPB19_11940 [Marinobacter salinisoli]|uniref:Phosphate ABC transporter substrate-binding protein n=1 Tax=Marinobacter salinisoli TaxID=2769486 RepID=A0ABX7MP40_9GAMM|nr:hypothetical protein [Marinobacter salinisoli]QSP93904.1 hypothetical protein LPB19_11940 [Marinobacter salinisoli]
MMRVLVFLLLLAINNVSGADIYVVANAKSPIEQISREALRDLYLGRTKALPNGEFASVYDREESSDLRARFYRHVTGMELRQVDAFWARLVFAGRMLPLEEVTDQQRLVSLIKSDVNAISYLEAAPESSELKVIYRVPDGG